MIYSVFLIDGDSGILLLDHTMKHLEGFTAEDAQSPSNEKQILANFFQAMNGMIDDIHKGMRKGRDLSQMTRILQSEGATVILYYFYEGRILLCSISDADDDTDRIVEVLRYLGKRFWQKHRVDVDKFRFDGHKDILQSFITDIEILTLGGKFAEQFPKLIVSLGALEKIRQMGLISEIELEIGKICKERVTALQICRKLNVPRIKIIESLKKLSKLELIQI